jgi:hypothetical protein
LTTKFKLVIKPCERSCMDELLTLHVLADEAID